MFVRRNMRKKLQNINEKRGQESSWGPSTPRRFDHHQWLHCLADWWHNEIFFLRTTLLDHQGLRQGCPLTQLRSSGNVHVATRVVPSQHHWSHAFTGAVLPRIVGKVHGGFRARWPKLPRLWLMTLRACYRGSSAAGSSHLAVAVVPVHGAAVQPCSYANSITDCSPGATHGYIY
jgi:hypothetical protein